MRRQRSPLLRPTLTRPTLNNNNLQRDPVMGLPDSAEKVSSEAMAYYHGYRRPLLSQGEFERMADNHNVENASSSSMKKSSAAFGGMKSILLTNNPAAEIPARLDPVDGSTIARLKWQLLRQATEDCAWMRHILQVLDDASKMKIADEEKKAELIEKKGVPKNLNMHNNLKHVLEQLTKSGMYEKFYKNSKVAEDNERRARMIARAVMFMVEKIGKIMEVNIDGKSFSANALRVITDARWANVSFINNLPYNIYTLDALFQCFSNACRRSFIKTIFFLNADLRHWFFQIPLPTHWRESFRFEFEEIYYRPRVLPMGWYLSPPIAQTCTWGIILTGDPPGVDKRWLKNLQVMPPWIPLENNQGGVFVIQDNIFIFSENEDLVRRWQSHLKERAEYFNAEFKGGQGLDLQSLSEGDGKTTEFNGIEFSFGRWRTANRKIRDPIEGVDFTRLTHRDIHSLLGEVLWDLRVREEFVLDHEKFMRLFKINTPAAVSDWGRINSNFTEAHFEILKKEVVEARKHQWAEVRPRSSPNPCENMEIYAVDASMGGKGSRKDPHAIVEARLAICKAIGNVNDKTWHWKNCRRNHVYIGEAELEAIVWAVEEAIESNPNVELIVIATDSMCAKGWVERMYSDRIFANELLRHLHTLLNPDGKANGQKIIKLSCIYVLSEHNIADVPTRDEEKVDHGVFDIEMKEHGDRLNGTAVVVKAVISILKQQLVYSGARVISQKRLETEVKTKKVDQD